METDVFVLKPMWPLVFTSFTIEFWVKFLSPPNGQTDFLSDSGSPSNFLFGTYSTETNKLNLQMSAISFSNVPAFDLSANNVNVYSSSSV